ncbi:MAG: hypothetical protein QNK36_21275 [Colwellia sp.]|nr:hypothetical protein [Colwellia sp.]
MTIKTNTMVNDDGLIRIKINNSLDRSNTHELFTAMGFYMNAVEEFNRLVIHSVRNDATLQYKFHGVEDGSIISKVKSVFNFVGKHFEEAVDSVAINEVCELVDTKKEVTEPQDVFVLANQLSDKLSTLLISEDIVKPHIDPVKLAKILMLISDGNECLLPIETVELSNHGKVTSINTKFRSKVHPSKMLVTTKLPFDGVDKVIVIRPCNFGSAKWDLKSILTDNNYSSSFHKDCDWLTSYQNGEFPTVTARDTLKISVTYDKYITGKDFVIKNAIIKDVEVLKGRKSVQLSMKDNLD